jgi:8-oxo-dGTP pyrophosphatase MutT (NUDIX family)
LPVVPEDDAAEPRRPSRHDLVRWAEALSGIARTGLGFTESLYERERFEEVLAVAADIAHAAGGEDFDHDATIEEWLSQVGKGVPGYVTPKVAVAAIVGNEKGELLLVQRADSGIWLYPTGWADVGYSPSEVAVKEVREETGIECEVVRFVGVLDGLRLGFTRVPMFLLQFHCRALTEDLTSHPLEVADCGFFGEDNLPWPVAGFELWGPTAFAAVRNEPVEPFWDRPRPQPWQSS